ncbi:MAG TPA: hypothetical protein PLN85_01835 [archaeon]|nr:hypothetical protein [archaeon]
MKELELGEITFSPEEIKKFKDYISNNFIDVYYSAHVKENGVDILLFKYVKQNGQSFPDLHKMIRVPFYKSKKLFLTNLNQNMIKAVIEYQKELRSLNMKHELLSEFRELLREYKYSLEVVYQTKTKAVILIKDKNDNIVLVKTSEVKSPVYQFYYDLNKYFCTELKNINRSKLHDSWISYAEVEFLHQWYRKLERAIWQ